MTADEYDRLSQLAQSWADQIHRQGVQRNTEAETELMAHEAYWLNRCSAELKAFLATVTKKE